MKTTLEAKLCSSSLKIEQCRQWLWNLLGKKYIFPYFILTSVHHLVWNTKILRNKLVAVLQPAPTWKPLPNSQAASALTAPFPSHAHTPRSEPMPTKRILSVSEVANIFSYPNSPWFSWNSRSYHHYQRTALEKAATSTDAGVNDIIILCGIS